MIECADFFSILNKNGIKFFTGVPDSLLKDFCGFISDNVLGSHIIAANEGNAVGIAVGYHMATGKIPLVYLQNSGLGNAINPITSLTSSEVYKIPLVFLIGWRGQLGISDEPQHKTQGRITKEMLSILDIPFVEINSRSQHIKESVDELVDIAAKKSTAIALLISKDVFKPYIYNSGPNDGKLSRENAVKYLAKKISSPKNIIVSTTGKLSRELYEYRRHQKDGAVDFYNVGSMGHLSQIALGLAKFSPKKNIFCFDGDGAAIMHLGGLAIVANNNLKNYFYVMFNNGAHDSVGGQSTIAKDIDFEKISLGFGFRQYLKAETLNDLEKVSDIIINCNGPVFLEIIVKRGARKELGRPNETPEINKISFMKYIQNSNE